MAAKLFIGTSGWHYKHWTGVFYPKDLAANEMFGFYAQHFDTVEINNTFYHLPDPKTVDAWRNNSPAGFHFAVKASRFITHMKKLKDPKSSTAKFFSIVADRLEGKLGPILFQLPPRWHVNIERLAGFFEVLPEEYRYAVEFRDASWLTPPVFGMLRKYNVAFCIHDLGDMQIPPEITSDFTYVRLHGPHSAKYSGSYSHQQLSEWARQIEHWRGRLSAIYVYFNNDVGGWAVKNAVELRKLVQT